MSIFHEGVDPVRLESMIERRDVLVRYCKIERPTAVQTARYAKKLGISAGSLYHLVRAWRIAPELKAMGGARIKQERVPKLSCEVMQIITETIEDRGAGSSVKKINETVRDSCVASGLEPPTLSAVHERVMKARTLAKPADQSRRFSAFQCRVDLPVKFDGRIAAPYVTGIIDLPSKRIINSSIAIGTAEPFEVAVRALLHERRRLGGETLVLVPTKKLKNLAKEINHPLGSAGRENSAPALLGRRIDRLPILHRSYPGADEKLAKKITGRMNTALSQEDAVVTVAAALDAHNDERGGL